MLQATDCTPGGRKSLCSILISGLTFSLFLLKRPLKTYHPHQFWLHFSSAACRACRLRWSPKLHGSSIPGIPEGLIVPSHDLKGVQNTKLTQCFTPGTSCCFCWTFRVLDIAAQDILVFFFNEHKTQRH